MRTLLLGMVVVIAGALLLAGCSGASHSGSGITGSTGGTGGVTFAVDWGDAGRGARDIPSTVQSITITATQQLTQVGQVTITRPAATGYMGNIPAGYTCIAGTAYDSGSHVLATGSLTVTVVAYQNVAAPLVLTPGNGGPLVNANAKDGATMVWVPAGTFLMGTPGDTTGDEFPHVVYLDGYWIGMYDITVAQFSAFCVASGYTFDWNGRIPSYGWQPNYPMTDVTWADAVAYADWAGCSLPTEAQWEKAARGTDGRVYPWGNTWDTTKIDGSIAPVGSVPAGASPYGAQDMEGLVWQWCADWYDPLYYLSSPASNPTGPTTGTARALRGDGWVYVGNSDYFRCAYRNNGGPTDEGVGIGFRCVSTAPGP